MGYAVGVVGGMEPVKAGCGNGAEVGSVRAIYEGAVGMEGREGCRLGETDLYSYARLGCDVEIGVNRRCVKEKEGSRSRRWGR